MYGYPFALMSDKEKAWMEKNKQERMLRAVPWTPDVKWDRCLTFKADTYEVPDLFPSVKPMKGLHVWQASKQEYVESPSGKYRYAKKVLPAGEKLSTWHGSRVGDVMFDGPVVIPGLWENQGYDAETPWMSITPAEMLSLRCGTRFAKGHTIVAGLGLGYQLMEVLKRKQVKRVTLVEKEQELVDWLWPVLVARLPSWDQPPAIEVVVGDAYKVIPTLEADVCLLDIFTGYGCNKEDGDKIARASPKVKKVWTWGSAPIADREFYGGFW